MTWITCDVTSYQNIICLVIDWGVSSASVDQIASFFLRKTWHKQPNQSADVSRNPGRRRLELHITLASIRSKGSYTHQRDDEHAA